MQRLEAEIERLLAHPHFDRAAHRLAQGFLAVQEIAPRLASQFSTQQRWLMSHAVLSHYFRGLSAGRPGLSRRDFVEQTLAHGLASRNTAAAFFVEALQYGLIWRPLDWASLEGGVGRPLQRVSAAQRDVELYFRLTLRANI